MVFLVYSAEPHWSISNSVVKRYKSTKILGGTPPGKIVQCQSFQTIVSESWNYPRLISWELLFILYSIIAFLMYISSILTFNGRIRSSISVPSIVLEGLNSVHDSFQEILPYEMHKNSSISIEILGNLTPYPPIWRVSQRFEMKPIMNSSNETDTDIG